MTALIAAALALPACAGTENPREATAAVTDVQERRIEARAADDTDQAAEQEASRAAGLARAEERGAANARRDLDRAADEEAKRIAR